MACFASNFAHIFQTSVPFRALFVSSFEFNFNLFLLPVYTVRYRIPRDEWWLRLRPLLQALATPVNLWEGELKTANEFVKLLDS